MGKQKKSRKIGLIGVPKSDRNTKSSRPQKKPKKTSKGNKAGSRQAIQNESVRKNSTSKASNSKLGSKTPIDLSKYQNPSKSVNQAKKELLSPEQELAQIERDAKLEKLLDKSVLSHSEQTYVDNMTKRYAELCDILGINQEDEQKDDSDPFEQLDALNIDDFKH